jgi:hypothetical protein
MQTKRPTRTNFIGEGRHLACLQTSLFNVGANSISRTAGQTNPTWWQALSPMHPAYSSAHLVSKAREWISDPQRERRLRELNAILYTGCSKLRAQVGLLLSYNTTSIQAVLDIRKESAPENRVLIKKLFMELPWTALFILQLLGYCRILVNLWSTSSGCLAYFSMMRMKYVPLKRR